MVFKIENVGNQSKINVIHDIKFIQHSLPDFDYGACVCVCVKILQVFKLFSDFLFSVPRDWILAAGLSL